MSVSERSSLRRNNESSSLRISKLIFTETGEYCKQFARGYEATLDGNTAASLVEHLETAGVRNRRDQTLTRSFDKGLLSGIAGQIIHPAERAGRMIDIPNGWGNRRFSFMMAVEISESEYDSRHEILTGYTDYNGLTTTRGGMAALDDDMVLYVTNTIRTRVSRRRTASATRDVTVLEDFSQLIASSHYGHDTSSRRRDTSDLVLQRPKDLVSTIQTLDLDMEDADIIDTRTRIKHTSAEKSRRQNNTADSFLSRMINGVNDAAARVLPGSGDGNALLDNALRDLAEEPIRTDPILRVIASVRDEQFESAFFTWRDLRRLDPDLANDERRLIAVTLDRPSRTRTAFTEYTKEDGGSGITDRFMAVIKTAIPAIMMEYGVAELKFSATNMTRNLDTRSGQYVLESRVMVSDMLLLSDSDAPEHMIDSMESALQARVFDDLASFQGRSNEIEYDVEIAELSFTSDSFVKLSVGGGSAESYAIPTFADSLWSPCITDSNEAARGLATAIRDIVGEVIPAYGRDADADDDANFSGHNRLEQSSRSSGRNRNTSRSSNF